MTGIGPDPIFCSYRRVQIRSRAPSRVASGPSVRAALGRVRAPDQWSSPPGATWIVSPGVRLGNLVGLRRGLRGRQGSLKEEGQQEGEKKGGNGSHGRRLQRDRTPLGIYFPWSHDERPDLEDNALGCRPPCCDRATARTRSVRLVKFGPHGHTTARPWSLESTIPASRTDARACHSPTVTVRPGFVRTLVLFAVFLLFVLVLLLALEALQLLEQPVHLVFKVAEPALDADGARAGTGTSHAGTAHVHAGPAAGRSIGMPERTRFGGRGRSVGFSGGLGTSIGGFGRSGRMR